MTRRRPAPQPFGIEQEDLAAFESHQVLGTEAADHARQVSGVMPSFEAITAACRPATCAARRGPRPAGTRDALQGVMQLVASISRINAWSRPERLRSRRADNSGSRSSVSHSTVLSMQSTVVRIIA
ncbi:hypothetical protein AWV80_10635 [Cupriavidus sp. UYMU48A]|nr:hypothetical protein AWV80_10635 [Cupriavidus sp. UYMU48A]